MHDGFGSRWEDDAAKGYEIFKARKDNVMNVLLKPLPSIVIESPPIVIHSPSGEESPSSRTNPLLLTLPASGAGILRSADSALNDTRQRVRGREVVMWPGTLTYRRLRPPASSPVK